MLSKLFKRSSAPIVNDEAVQSCDTACIENRCKELIAHISHEIRSPLCGILGTTDILLETTLTNDQRGLLFNLKSSVEYVLTLANDVLDFSKIESGKLELVEGPFNLRWLLHDIESSYFARFSQKRIVFIIEADSDIPHELIGDELRLRQVISNILSNAIKFTPVDGAIFLRVRLEGVYEGKAHLAFHVSDTGIGISKEKQGKIFNPYEQAEAETSKKFGGTGLGLSIVKEFVKKMGGDLYVESRQGVGSVFSFTITLSIGDEKPEYVDVPQRELAILLVEDDILNERMTRMLLERAGHTVHVARTGREAVDFSSATFLDLILMDLQLPDLDGDQAAMIIRENGSATPIVAFTGHHKSDVASRVERAGMNGIISKPVDRHALLSGLQQYVQ